MAFTVAIVGRPNVGKSTLFNRLVGQRLALVDDTPGVTRDRREGTAHLGGMSFRVFDTAGLGDAAAESLEGRMRQQSEAAIAEADVCLFLIDVRAGVMPLDTHFAALLRKSDKPVVLIANKCEGRAAASAVYEAYALGLGEPIALSAEHGEGLGDLYDALRPHYEASREEEGAVALEPVDDEQPSGEGGDGHARDGAPLRVAIIGRPNAGKSTLINKLLEEERLLTGPEAGITRDSISVDWTWRGRALKLFDTAGIRRRARVTGKLEKLSVGDALRAVRFAEVVVILMDADMPLEKQDLHIADLVAREGRAPVLVVNKWDTVKDKSAALAHIREGVERLLPQIRGVPLVTISAKTGQGLEKLMDAVFEIDRAWNARVSTGALNRWFEGTVERHPPPAARGRHIRLRYITQAKNRPPTFIVFSSRAHELPESYSRYLVNSLREDFSLWGTPIRIQMRKGDNPYVRKS
jgi:GTP-binding protein